MKNQDNNFEILKQRLANVVEEEFIDEWMNKSNSAFNNRKPIDLVNEGDFDPLFRMLHRLESGEPG